MDNYFTLMSYDGHVNCQMPTKWLRTSSRFKRTNIYITTSVLQIFDILCIMFKMIAFFKTTTFDRLYVRVGILLYFMWKARLCVGAIDYASFYDFSIELWNCSDSVVFFIILLDHYKKKIYSKTYS
jgi:hypothetical protein